MKVQQHKASEDKHKHAYTKMLGRVRDSLEHVGEKSKPILQAKIDEAKERAIEVGELSREEAEKVAEYLSRDMHDAQHFLSETGSALADWIQFDWMLVEDRLWNMFSQVADKTQVELLQFKRQFQQNETYEAGQIMGIGSLVCTTCGHIMHFHEVEEIPPCPSCQRAAFKRVQFTPFNDYPL